MEPNKPFVVKDLTILNVQKSMRRMPLALLRGEVLRFIFDNKNMTLNEKSDMMNSIVNWSEWVKFEKDRLAKKYGNDYVYKDIRPVGTKGTPLDEVEYRLSRLAWMLREAEQGGKVWKQKALFGEHGIDYKKAYGLTRATKAEHKRALRFLKKSDIENEVG